MKGRKSLLQKTSHLIKPVVSWIGLQSQYSRLWFVFMVSDSRECWHTTAHVVVLLVFLVWLNWIIAWSRSLPYYCEFLYPSIWLYVIVMSKLYNILGNYANCVKDARNFPSITTKYRTDHFMYMNESNTPYFTHTQWTQDGWYKYNTRVFHDIHVYSTYIIICPVFTG